MMISLKCRPIRVIPPPPGPAGLRHWLRSERGYSSAEVRRVPLSVQRRMWRRAKGREFWTAQSRTSEHAELGIIRRMQRAMNGYTAALLLRGDGRLTGVIC